METGNGRSLNVHGLNLRTSGPAGSPAIILIHGSGCDGSLWDPLSERLAEWMRVIAIDLPGHGGSAPRPGDGTMQTYAGAIMDAVASLALKNPIIGGHSLGGAVALTTVLENPGVAGGLALIGSGARLRVLPAIIEAIKSGFEAAIENVGGFSFGPGADPAVAKAAQAMMLRNGREAMLADFLACDSFDVIARLPGIKIPALAVCGDADALTPPKYSRFLADKIPGCHMQTIPGAGHMVMLEAPGPLAEAIKDFVTSSGHPGS